MTEPGAREHAPAISYAWTPQLGPQAEAMRTAYWCDELFFGGARGGGKTDFLLGDFLADIDLGEAWQGVLFRKSYPELDEIIRRSGQLFEQTGEERGSSTDVDLLYMTDRRVETDLGSALPCMVRYGRSRSHLARRG